jgi:hypothetical protein
VFEFILDAFKRAFGVGIVRSDAWGWRMLSDALSRPPDAEAEKSIVAWIGGGRRMRCGRGCEVTKREKTER